MKATQPSNPNPPMATDAQIDAGMREARFLLDGQRISGTTQIRISDGLLLELVCAILGAAERAVGRSKEAIAVGALCRSRSRQSCGDSAPRKPSWRAATKGNPA